MSKYKFLTFLDFYFDKYTFVDENVDKYWIHKRFPILDF